MKRLLSLIGILMLLSVYPYGLPTQTSAATTSSSSAVINSAGGCVVTKVGNPSDPSPTFSPDCSENSTQDGSSGTGSGSGSDGGTITGSNGDLVAAAEDLVHAYQTCGGGVGNTTLTSSLAGCLYNQLKGKYSTSSLALFANDYDTLKQYTWNSTGTVCVECIGFVRQALILAHKAAADDNLSQHSAYYLVGAHIPTFTVGSSIVYKDMGTSNPQPGDVAIVDSYFNGNEVGHILIIKSVDPSGYSFTAIESNYNPFCTATDVNKHTQPDASEGGNKYHYYRKQ